MRDQNGAADVISKKNMIQANSKMKKVYKKPDLQSLGDLRSVVLGGTPGLGESGRRSPRHHGFSGSDTGIGSDPAAPIDPGAPPVH